MRLRHLHIIRLLDFGFDKEDNTPYLIMEYAPNRTLRDRHPKATMVQLGIIADYIEQLADALQYAHGQRLIQRDFKPENILVGNNGEILLSDFGVAANSNHLVEAALSLRLLGIVLVTIVLVRRLIPRCILILTGLAIVVSGYVFIVQAQFDLNLLILILPEANLLRTVGLVAASLFSLLWLARPFSLTDRIILVITFGIALACALLQYSYEEFGNFVVLKHILLVITLITLSLGTLVVTEMERMRAEVNRA